jgi:hypothetical protein
MWMQKEKNIVCVRASPVSAELLVSCNGVVGAWSLRIERLPPHSLQPSHTFPDGSYCSALLALRGSSIVFSEKARGCRSFAVFLLPVAVRTFPRITILQPKQRRISREVIRTSSIDWAQLSRFHLKTETKSSLRNVVRSRDMD